MSEFLIGIDGRPPDESFLLLTEVFHLEDQLAELSSPQQTEEK
jgi:L-rhamnose mutarotase